MAKICCLIGFISNVVLYYAQGFVETVIEMAEKSGIVLKSLPVHYAL